MRKSQLIAEIAAAKPHLRTSDVELVVNTILDGIADAMIRGDRVELRGFGIFTNRRRRARTAAILAPENLSRSPKRWCRSSSRAGICGNGSIVARPRLMAAR